ncbi:MAG: prephenate dehydrogenase/arogenate dehydrogenase family protein [Fibrobacteraceae bacterium]|nr:prephenate dehydrogenase/arogenate dehydrogenase family protein [Fibrobacteraceae bacterium]
MTLLSINRITLVGFGLLASSIAAAIKQARLSVIVRAVSSEKTLVRAKELGLADETFAYDDLEHWVEGSDVILLCTPISGILSTLKKLSAFIPSHPVFISDIGSTKAEICKAGAQLKAPFTFVGSHPMAGSEKRTLEFNDPSIFENAYWFVCPPAGAPENSYKVLSELIAFVGATQIVFSSEHHDQTVAWVSHMPQMASSSLAANIPNRLLQNGYQHFAGRAFRDMTRIAASGWAMWKDIAETNRTEILRAMDEYAEGLHETRNAIEKLPADDQPLHDIFLQGNAGRASLFASGKNPANSFYQLTVQLKDKPGALLSVLEPLADAGLNVRDIELMKVRENVAGTLLIAFKTEEQATAACKLLRYLEFEVMER